MAGHQAGINVKPHPDRHAGRISRIRQALSELPAEATEKRAELQESLTFHEGELKRLIAEASAALAGDDAKPAA